MPIKVQSRVRNAKTRGPQVCVLDIETTPPLSWHWRCYKENIGTNQTERYGRVLCWAAKWLGEETVFFQSARREIAEGCKALRKAPKAALEALGGFDYPAFSDRRICEGLWDLIDRADMVIAHNGQAFDICYLQARWADLRMPPPSPYRMVDTLKVARANFNTPSRRLDALLRYFDLGAKLQHIGMDMWKGCMRDSAEDWRVMEEYNVIDTCELEALYLLIRPWDKRHPHVGMMHQDGDSIARCVCCGSTALVELPEPTRTAVSAFPTYRCESCGKPMRGRRRLAQALGQHESGGLTNAQ